MNDLILIFLLLIIITIVIDFFKSPYFKGKAGETLVNLTNNIRLDKSIYSSLTDVTIKLNDNSTTQIDHIIISKFGIFVIETKNMKGWIFGSKEQKKWTQNIYGKKHTFQNPLHQNYRHTKAIEEVLNFNENVHSVVTFIGECTFKTDMPHNVFIGGKYINYIKSFRTPIFTTLKVKEIISLLENKSLNKTRSTNNSHISSLKNRHSETYLKDPKITCKKCSSAMIKRSNKKTGKKFLGCSKYPKCRNTEQP